MIGEILNKRYRLLRILGTGRCGKTFLAEDTQSEGLVSCVIKQFEPEAKDTLSLRKAKYLFAREVKTLKILGQSDRIPRLLDYFRQSEKFYLVHEFVNGTDLAQELGQPWTEIEVSELLREILEIVEVAHREKVVHQDIKPSNIIRRKSDNKLMLIDFGSIKKINNQMANAEGNTMISVPIGTPGYMAPEQKSLKPRLASDIYAVGTICLYALTGTEPKNLPLDHYSETIQWRGLVRLSPQFTKIIDRLVSPNLDRRYADAGEALLTVRKLSSGGKLLDLKTIGGIGIFLVALLGGGFYYWRLESSLNQTSEMEMFETEQTNFPLVYQNARHGVSMKYPAAWKLSLPESESATVAQFSPEKDDSFLIPPKVKIEVASAQAKSLDEYTTNLVYQITQQPKAKIIDSRPAKFAGRDGHKISYTLVDPKNSLEQRYLQVWTLKNNLVYGVIYEATVNDYADFLDTVELEMLNTVQIESPKATEEPS
ncbi:MAG: serine/threonine-protein kinase [Cyanobacteria bacterium J06623_7]